MTFNALPSTTATSPHVTQYIPLASAVWSGASATTGLGTETVHPTHARNAQSIYPLSHAFFRPAEALYKRCTKTVVPTPVVPLLEFTCLRAKREGGG
jgi:hypothetical protein